MTAYYFHLTNGDETRDGQGTELASLHDARCYAVQMIAEVLCNAPERYWQHEEYRVTVSDESGLTLFIVEMVSTDAASIGNLKRRVG